MIGLGWPASSNASIAATAEAPDIVLDDRLGLGVVAASEFGADDIDALFLEDAVGRRPARLQHVDAGQDAEAQHLAALRQFLSDEICGLDAPAIAADRIDEGHRAL